MLVVDMSAWIEYLKDTPTGERVEARWPRHEFLIVPTLVQFELARWARRELPENDADHMLGQTRKCRVIPLHTQTALAAAEVAQVHKLVMADAIIYATALQCGDGLLTCDRHFAGLPHVVSVDKAPA